MKRKVNGEDSLATYAPAGKLPEILEAFEKAKKASSNAEIVALINNFDLPREAIPDPAQASVLTIYTSQKLIKGGLRARPRGT